MFFYQILIGSLFLFTFLLLTTTLGTVLVKENRHFSENRFLILPIGFIAFFALTFILYLPFVIFNSNLVILAVFELLKDVLIAYFVFYRIRPVLNVWIRMLKHLSLIFIAAGLFLIIQWLSINTSTDGADQTAYNGWIVFNGKSFVLQSRDWYTGAIGGNYGGLYFSQTWYYFNTIIALAFRINVNVLMFWVDGLIIYMFAIAIMLSLFSIFVKKKIFLKYLFSMIFLSIFTFIAHYNQPAIVGLVARTYLFIAMLVFFIYFSRSNDKNLIFWSNVTFLAAWSFSSSTLFIFAIFYYAVVMYMIFMNKQNIISITLLMAIPITFCLGIQFFYTQFVIFLLLSIGITGVLFVLNWSSSYWTNYRFQKIDTLLYSRKWVILILPILGMFAISMLFLLNGRLDWWLNFNPRMDGLQVGDNSSEITTWATYAFYWISFLLVFIFTIKKIKQFEFVYPLIFVSFVSVITFFNPLVSGFINGTIIPTSVYHRVRTDFFVPVLFISAIIGLQAINVKHLNIMANVIFASSLIVPVGLNYKNIPTNSFVNPTASVGVGEVTDYLNMIENKNKNQELQIDGDIQGLRALTDIPMGPFLRGSREYYLINQTKINQEIFNTNPVLKTTENDKHSYILIKLKWNVANDFDFYKNGFKLRIEFNNYFVYLPFLPT